VCARLIQPDRSFAPKAAVAVLEVCLPLVLVVAVPFVAVRSAQKCFLFETCVQHDVVGQP